MGVCREGTRILLVDDDDLIRRAYTKMLLKAGYDVVASDGAEVAMQEARKAPFDIVLTDVRMPRLSGDALVEELKKIQPSIVAVLMTAFPSMDVAVQAVRNGVYEFLTKPLELRDLREVVERVLARREGEVQRIQWDFAEDLLQLQRKRGPGLDTRAAIAALLDVQDMDEILGVDESEGPEPDPASGDEATQASDDRRKTLTLVLCEQVPRDSDVLRRSEDYRHFRALYSAYKVFREQLVRSGAAVDLRLAMIHKPSDIPRLLRQRRVMHGICCVIFGPNYPNLSEGTVRLMASGGQQRLVAVCHNPVATSMTWGRLTDLSRTMSIRVCRTSAPSAEVRRFWSRFFARDLRSLVARLAAGSAMLPVGGQLLSPVQIRACLQQEQASLESMPDFPPACARVLQALDAGRRYGELEEMIDADEALAKTVLRCANVVRGEGTELVTSVAMALSLIGVEGARKVTLARALAGLLRQVEPCGFETAPFLKHSLAAGLTAQVLSLDLESPSRDEEDALQALHLDAATVAALRQLGLWRTLGRRGDAGADAFTVGLLHDVGKAVNTICYKGIYPLVLHEVERSRWDGNLLEAERAIVGDFVHPATGERVLAHWGFGAAARAVRGHHRIEADAAADCVLVALANSLVKGLYPFPRRIDIPDAFRRAHLGPVVRSEDLANPLTPRYEALQRQFRALERQVQGGDGPRLREGVFGAAVEAVRGDAKAYILALIKQSPEVLDVAEWTGLPMTRLAALSLLLCDTLEPRVEQLFDALAPVAGCAPPVRKECAAPRESGAARESAGVAAPPAAAPVAA